MTLPNLIIPGAGKSGTSSLHDSLQLHPDIFMSRRKEPHYFSSEASPDEQRAYEGLFEESDRCTIRGESSTSYMVIPDAPERIKRALESPKIIFILRNPVDRVASHYRWLQSLGLEPRSLRRAFSADIGATPSMDEAVLNSGNFRYYHQHSSYGTALERYLAYFDRNQIKVVTFESFITAHARTMRECFEFLGVPEGVRVEEVRSNTTQNVTGIRGSVRSFARTMHSRFPSIRRLQWAYLGLGRTALGIAEQKLSPGGRRGLKPGDRVWLADQLADDVEKLRTIWGEDFSEWSSDFPL